VDELAGRCGVSVDTIRFYQTKGLLPLPERDGRVGWYGDDHVERLARIKDLKDKGFTLNSIKRLLSGGLDPADTALVDALAGSLPGGEASDPAEGSLTLDELAERTGIAPSVLQVIEREGLLGKRSASAAAYTESDVAVVKAGLELLDAGLPLSELLALAREHDAAMQQIARRAVDLFVEFVRDPARAEAGDAASAERVVAAFRKMLPATTSLVSNHFRSALLAEAQARIELETNEDSPASESA
jgi:DNA-binding transcriptional MerR regulator